MNGLVLLSSGESRRNLCAGTITALVVSLAFCVGVVWGAIGVAWAYAVVNWGMSIPMQVYSFKGTSIQLIDFLRACFLPLIASALAALFITLVEGVFEDFSVILTILLKGVFMLMVMIITLFLDEKLRRIIFSILRKMVLRL
jgi:hypothetical protein